MKMVAASSTSTLLTQTGTIFRPSFCSPSLNFNNLSKSPFKKTRGLCSAFQCSTSISRSPFLKPQTSAKLPFTIRIRPSSPNPSCFLRKGSRAQMGSVQQGFSDVHLPDSFGWVLKCAMNHPSVMYALAEIVTASRSIFTAQHNSTTKPLEDIIEETKGIDFGIFFRRFMEAINEQPEVSKGTLEKIVDVLSKRPLTWVSVCTYLLVQAAILNGKSPEEISFDNIIGLKDAKADMQLIVKALKGDRQFVEFGEKSLGGVLICGPENTGKETLVNAMAYEAKVPFFDVSAQAIAKDGVTKGKRMIMILFLVARLCPRCLIYIKDIDVIDEKKTTTESGPNLLQLLKEMEKCNKDGHMAIVIGSTTKKPELLDPKLRNSEYFLREVLVDKPDKDARGGFVDLYLTKDEGQKNKEEIRTLIVSQTEGFVRNDISRVCRLSKQNAREKGCKYVTTADVNEGLKTVKSSITTSMAQEKQLMKDGENVSKVNVLATFN